MPNCWWVLGSVCVEKFGLKLYVYVHDVGPTYVRLLVLPILLIFSVWMVIFAIRTNSDAIFNKLEEICMKK